MELSQLEEALKKSWCKETSSDAQNWTPENPAWGQCAVTSLLVNDYFGGKIVWAEATLPDGRKISHYFNNYSSFEADLTRQQFPSGTIIPKGIQKTKGFSTTREYILSYEQTKERYELLKKKVQELIS